MAGCRVPQNSLLQVNEKIGGGNKMLFEFATESAVEARENERGIVDVGGLAGEGDFQHGSDESRGDAVAGDIGDENAEALLVDRKKVVEVSRDGAHGNVASGDFKTGICRKG